MFLNGAAERRGQAGGLSMNGFAKIFASMLRSTVWVGQPWHVKLTWITLLMLADAEGNVWASVPGLARDAEVTPEQCEQALAVFMAPDRHSRTKAHEGRRIIEIDGGWHILNHLKYRELQTRKQALAAKRARDHYARKTGKLPAASGFESVAPDVRSVRPNAANAADEAEAAVYGTAAPRKKRTRKAQTAETTAPSVRPNAPNGSLLLPLSDQSLEDHDHPDPDPIPNHPAKDGSARATPLPSGVFEAPVLHGVAASTLDVPEWWQGPTEAHLAFAAEFRLDCADEAARFRLTHFQRAFPATPDGVDKRFMLWLREARVRADTERGKQFLHGGGAAAAPGARRGRMPTNGVAQLQPDEGRTGFESLELPEPEPERPRRAARR